MFGAYEPEGVAEARHRFVVVEVYTKVYVYKPNSGGAVLEFEWDEDKRQHNLEKHKVDFRRAARIFNGPIVSRQDTRADYGEERLISIGVIDLEFYVLVHTGRDDVIRIISARLGGRRDRKYYYAHLT